MIDWLALGKGLVRSAEHTLPLNIGMLLGTIAGDRKPITQKDLGPKDLAAMRAAAVSASKNHSSLIGYGDYPTDHDAVDFTGWLPSFRKSVGDPGYRAATTVGAAKMVDDKAGNTHIVDTYDFNADGPGAAVVHHPSFGNILHALKHPTVALDALGFLAAPDTASNRRQVNINVGKIR